MPSRLVLLILALVLAACDSSETAPVSLRVENTSGRDFASVVVSSPGAEADYGAVAAGQSSAYHEFETAYRYAGVVARTAGETYALTPIDYVGEEPLAAGRYTYVLDVEEGALRLELRED